jgi:hypothetical protein
VHIDIEDVGLTIACLDAPPAIREVRGNLALVWRDACGRPQWLAEPQRLPFLRSLRLDQIR